MGAEKEQFLKAKNGDEEALFTLVKENEGLVYAVAKRFLNRGQEWEDLVQIGMLGLVKAVRGYDVQKGFAFSTYAVPVIMGEIRCFLRDDGLIKVSRKMKSRLGKIKKAEEEYEKKFGVSPTLKELEKETGYSGEEISLAREAAVKAVSIDIHGDDEEERGGLLWECDAAKRKEEDEFKHIQISLCLSELGETERKLIGMRFYMDMTQSQVAKVLKLSQVSVSRMEKRILKELRMRLE